MTEPIAGGLPDRPRAMRCLEHGLVAGPDGRCVVCRRAQQQAIAGSVGAVAEGASAVAALDAEPGIPPGIAGPIATARAAWPRWAPVAAVGGAGVLFLLAVLVVSALLRGDATATPPATLTPVATLVASAPAPTAAAASQRVRVRIYTAAWCPSCRAAKAWMQRERVRYFECDVDHSEICSRELGRHNPRQTIPTFLVNDRVLVGFSPDRLSDAIVQEAPR